MVQFSPGLKLVGLSLFLISLSVGCGGAGGDGFKGARGQVTGTVMYQGKPVPAGTSVLFQAKDGASYTATGVVGSDGKYELSYQGKKDLPAVAYMVTLSPPANTAAAAATDPAAMADGQKLAEAAASAQAVIPAKYLSIVDTTLTFTVKEGANKADFTLE